MPPRPITVLLTIALLALPVSGAAREFGASASALGTADAVRASAAGPSAIYFNPAALARLVSYAIEAGYDYGNIEDGHGLHVAVADSKTNPYVAAGLSYAYLTADKDDVSRSGHQMRGALASGYRSPTFSALFGAGVRWKQLERTGEDFEDVSADVGALLELFQSVRLGVVGHNVVKVEDQSEMPIALGLGVSFTYGGMLLSFDTKLEFDSRPDVTPIYSVGLEYYMMGLLAFRTGFESDRVAEANRLSFGLGYVGQSWGFDVSYRQNVDDESDLVAAGTLRFFLP